MFKIRRGGGGEDSRTMITRKYVRILKEEPHGRAHNQNPWAKSASEAGGQCLNNQLCNKLNSVCEGSDVTDTGDDTGHF